MSKVVLIRCESYEYDTVKKSIERGISLIGGISLFVQKGENILLKPNILVGEAPEKCVTTHPAVFFKDDDKSIVPIYNYDNCIKCFCCQEICPESAIQLKTPFLRKIINSI